MLGSICEGNLKYALTEFFDACDEEEVEIHSIRDADSDSDIKMTIIDY